MAKDACQVKSVHNPLLLVCDNMQASALVRSDIVSARLPSMQSTVFGILCELGYAHEKHASQSNMYAYSYGDGNTEPPMTQAYMVSFPAQPPRVSSRPAVFASANYNQL